MEKLHEKIAPPDHSPDPNLDLEDAPPLENENKSTWERLWPGLACGAGLFSDGYLQSVIGSVETIFDVLYPKKWEDTTNPAVANIGAIAFAGTVFGQLIFGYTSDRYSRKWSLLVSTVIMIIFAILGAASYGGGTVEGMFSALLAYRFLIGIGIGGEYPAGSVACAEATGELKAGTRNRWFVLFTNVQIDIGFTIGTFVPMIVTLIAPHHLHAVWRISLALGVIPPLSLLYLRLKLKEPEATQRSSFRKGKTPYWLAFKFYARRLLLVMGIWFIYDFLTYPFSIYSSKWISVIDPTETTWQDFGWGTLINLFYVPGAIIGAFVSDWMGPRAALGTFVVIQGCVGLIMAGCYPWLQKPEYIGAFVVIYGLFLALGEVGPGDNIGLVASKTSATGIRGKYYGIAAATGKIGAYIGTYVFPYIEAAGGGDTTTRGGQYPFYVASCLCFVSAFLVWCLPTINQDTIEKEDIAFRDYLIKNGFDVSLMGNEEWSERNASLVPQEHE